MLNKVLFYLYVIKIYYKKIDFVICSSLFNSNLMDFNKLMKTCIVLMEYHQRKTLDARTMQTAIRIMFLDDPMLKTMIQSGTKYVTVAVGSSKKKITNWDANKLAVTEFMGTQAPNITNINYIISENAITYLTGVSDTINNQVQQF